MRRRRSALVTLCAALLVLPSLGCRDPDSTVAARAPEGPAPALAAEAVIEAKARPRVGVGEDLGLELWVRNDSDEALTLVRPIYGSWELARHPRYELEWRDERGQLVADPLGFAPGLSCGTLDPVTRGDLVKVEPGARARLANGPAARPGHEVLPSARPGRYQLRVRYLAQGIEGASELQILSEPVEVEITGGDAELWRCRAEQLAAEANHEWVDASPAGVIPADGGGFWLVTSDYRHRVVDRQTRPGGEVQLVALGPDLRPVAQPELVRGGDEEAGWVSVAGNEAGELLVVATPGPVGSRRVEAQSVVPSAGGAMVSPPQLLQAAPGNPYVTQLVARRDHFALLYTGDDARPNALLLAILDRTGAPLVEPRVLAEEVTDFALLPKGREDLVAVWLERGAVEGGVAAPLDGDDGQPLGGTFSFEHDPAHTIAGVHLDRSNNLELAWADSSTRGDDPDDMMGLYVRRFSRADGHPLGPVRALSPKSRTQAYFGAVAWHGSRLLRAYLDNDELFVGAAAGPASSVSATADGTVALDVIPDGYVALWSDTRDDRSRACLELDDCVAEVYGALLGPDASLRAGPVRLSRVARPKPFAPSSHDWQRYCP
jgi:hypothetical protein